MLFKVFMNIKKRTTDEEVSSSVLVQDFYSKRSAKLGASENALNNESFYTDVEIRNYGNRDTTIIGGENDTGIVVERYSIGKE